MVRWSRLRELPTYREMYVQLFNNLTTMFAINICNTYSYIILSNSSVN